MAQDAVAVSVAAGVRIAMGTDSGLTPDHGSALRELGLLVRFGRMSSPEAITAATRNAAELCGVADETGTLVAAGPRTS
ncbi:amidohydrolase family protein [Embleya sp. NPDC020630]|uniref:amidohydrolase family protein n=1 Tax=Embleya sp. NPDC020630 TaxID=3363979 RepID=UPI0037BD87DF